MLTNAERARLEHDILPWLHDTANIFRPQRTQDAYGVVREMVSLIGATPCRVSENRAAAELVAQQMANVAAWTVVVPAGADVRAGDILEVGGRRFRVTSVVGPSTFGVTQRCSCAEVSGG